MAFKKQKLGIFDLPLELRLHIYRFALVNLIDVTTTVRTSSDSEKTSDVNTSTAGRIINLYNEACSSQSILNLFRVKRATYRQGFEKVPYLALTLTCRTIYQEVSCFCRRTASSSLLTEVHTYRADLEVCMTEWSDPRKCEPFKIRTTLRWNQLPCPPTQAQRFVLNLYADTGGVDWVILDAVQDVFQDLLRNGPTLHNQNKLPSRMKLNCGILHLDERGDALIGPEHRWFLARKLHRWMDDGFVDCITIRFEDAVEVVMDNGGRIGGFTTQECDRLFESAPSRSLDHTSS